MNIVDKALELIELVEKIEAEEPKNVYTMPLGFCALHEQFYVGFCETCKIPICAKCLLRCREHAYKNYAMFIEDLDSDIPHDRPDRFVEMSNRLYEEERRKSEVMLDDRKMLLTPLHRDSRNLNYLIEKLPDDLEKLDKMINFIEETGARMEYGICKDAVRKALSSLNVKDTLEEDLKSRCANIEFTISEARKGMTEAQHLLIRSRCIKDVIEFYARDDTDPHLLKQYEQIAIRAGLRQITEFTNKIIKLEHNIEEAGKTIDGRDLLEMLDERKYQIVGEYEKYKKAIAETTKMLEGAEGQRKVILERKIAAMQGTSKRLLEEIHTLPGMEIYD